MDIESNRESQDYPEGWDRGPHSITSGDVMEHRNEDISAQISATNMTNGQTENIVQDVERCAVRYEAPPSYDSLYNHASLGILEDPSYMDTVASDDSTSALIKDELKKIDNVVEVMVTEIAPSGSGYQEDYMGYLSSEDLSKRVRSNTFAGVMESPAYIDEMHCGSTNDLRLIARACRNAVMTLSQDVGPKDLRETNALQKPGLTSPVMDDCEEISRHMKNLIILGISIFLVTTTNSLRNLQSSLNPDGGLGLYSLAGVYTGFMLFSLFSPFAVQWLRPKRCLLLGIIPHVIYVLANAYPKFSIFIPSSVLLGAGAALLWNSVSTYVTYVARSYALLHDLRTVHVASKYFGIVFFFYQFSIVAGNLISSMILMFGTNATTVNSEAGGVSLKVGGITVMDTHASMMHLNSNFSGDNTTGVTSDTASSLCGSQYCHALEKNQYEHSKSVVSEETKYLLFGVYGMASIFALVLAGLLLDPLKPYRSTLAKWELVCHQLKSILRCSLDKKFLLLLTTFAFSNMQNAFVSGEITKAFVTCPFGIHMVGYTMICFGVCAGISSYVSGHINKYIGHRPLLIIAGVTNIVLLAVLTLWRIQSDQVVLCFVVMGLWGVTDGIWCSQSSSLISDVFVDCLEEAFAAQRIIQGLGGVACFSYAPFLCMPIKILILGIVCLAGLLLLLVQGYMQRSSVQINEEEEAKE